MSIVVIMTQKNDILCHIASPLLCRFSRVWRCKVQFFLLAVVFQNSISFHLKIPKIFKYQSSILPWSETVKSIAILYSALLPQTSYIVSILSPLSFEHARQKPVPLSRNSTYSHLWCYTFYHISSVVRSSVDEPCCSAASYSSL